MNNSISGIQIIGTQRSGSNLLRVILDQSADIASPHPPHILITFMPLLSLYGDLDRDANYRLLVSDLVAFVEANPVPWDGVRLDGQDLFERSETRSLFELNRLIYEQAAKSKQARYWCCKSMNNVYYADQLEKQENKLKYIYLYRDGRDVAASFQKAVVGDKHVYHLARTWKQDQEASLRLSGKLDSGRLFSLNYETLITEPEQTVRKLCDFLDIGYTAGMLHFYDSATSKATAAAGEMWSNVEKPIMRNNTQKFLTAFKEHDLEIFELIAGDILKRLGYPLYTSLSATELLSEGCIEKYNAENEVLKREILGKTRQSDLDKRELQARILRRIRQRNLEKEGNSI